MKLSNAQIDEARLLHRQGWNFVALSEKFGCDPKTVQRAVDVEYKHHRCMQVRDARLARQATKARNAKAGRENAMGMDAKDDAAARLAEIPEDTRTLTQRLCGDPLFERSALYRKTMAT